MLTTWRSMNSQQIQNNHLEVLWTIKIHRQDKIRQTLHEKRWEVWQRNRKKSKFGVKENTVTELKHSTESFKSRLGHAEETISDLEHRTFEIIQVEEQKEKEQNRVKKIHRTYGTNEKKQYSQDGNSRRRKREWDRQTVYLKQCG